MAKDIPSTLKGKEKRHGLVGKLAQIHTEDEPSERRRNSFSKRVPWWKRFKKACGEHFRLLAEANPKKKP